MTRRDRLLLAALVAVYLLLAGAYAVITPAATAEQHNPDENAHMEYVATVASGHLPVFTDAMHGYENHQPPLYYMFAASVYVVARGNGEAAATRAVRWVSVAFGALLILVTFQAVLTLLPGRIPLAFGTAAFVAFLPSNLALNASVTNDSLTSLVASVALWLLIKMIRSADEREHFRLAVGLGIMLGLGLWTKSLTLSLFPMVAVTFLLMARFECMRGVAVARYAALALGLGGLIGAPWLIRNTLLYGDPLAQHLLLVTLNNGVNNTSIDVMIAVFHGFGNYLAKVAQWSFASFWGGFDSMSFFWDQNPRKLHANYAHGLSPTYQFLLVLCLLSLLGWGRRFPSRSVTAAERVTLLMLAAQAIFTGIAFLDYNLHFFQAQGRYLYPALVPLAFFFVAGWLRLLSCPVWQQGFVIALTAGLVGLNLYTVFGLLLPRFA